MLPNIDTISPGATTAGGNAPQRRPDTDLIAKTADAYKQRPVVADQYETAQVASNKKTEQSREATAAEQAKAGQNQDKVELNFTLSPEERDAFVGAFSSKQDPDKMSEEEKETLRKASERISKYIDEAIAKNNGNRERVEKAVNEWYSRITKDELEGPIDLVNLLRSAAMGNLDDL